MLRNNNTYRLISDAISYNIQVYSPNDKLLGYVKTLNIDLIHRKPKEMKTKLRIHNDNINGIIVPVTLDIDLRSSRTTVIPSSTIIEG